MPNRKRRRNAIRDQRRARQFVSILSGKDEKLDELKEKRPPDVAVEQVQNVTGEQVVVSDAVTQSPVANSVFRWGGPWSTRQWGETNVE